MARKKGIEVVSTNRKALHEYFILETFEAGMALFGSEIKSLRLKDCSLDSSFVRMDKGEAYLFNMHIKPYAFNTHTSLDPTRTRKLLLHRKEINKLAAANEIKGQTIVPLEIYLKNGWAKAHWPKVKKYTINAKPSKRKTSPERWNAALKINSNSDYEFYLLY